MDDQGQEKVGQFELVEAMIKHRKGLADIEAKLDAFELYGRRLDSRLDGVERLIRGGGIIPSDEIYPPFQAVLDVARRVVEARNYHGDDGWDRLKNAIAELSDALDKWEGKTDTLDARLMRMQGDLTLKNGS